METAGAHEPGPERPTKLAAWQGLVAAFAGMIAANVVGAVVAVGMLVIVALAQGTADPEALAELESAAPVVLAATAALQLTIAAFALLTPLLARVRLRDALGLGGAPIVVFPFAILGALALGPTADLIMSSFSALFPGFTLGVLEDMMKMFSQHPWWVLWPFIALMPGLCEELFFRGLLQRSMGNGALAILIASLAFAAIHLDPPHVMGVLPLGLYLGWLAARTDSLWVPVSVHVANNTFALIAVHVEALHVGFGTDQPMPWWWALAGLGVAAVCVAIIALATRHRRSPAASVVGSTPPPVG